MEEAEGNTLSQKGRRRGKKPPEKTLFLPRPALRGGERMKSVAFTARQTRLVIPSPTLTPTPIIPPPLLYPATATARG